MAKFELKLPQMGESVAEATIISWIKEVGDVIEQDEAVLEIATDKVDTEVPSEVTGILLEKRFEVDQVVQVGDVIAVIEIKGDSSLGVSAVGQKDEKEPHETAPQITNEVPFVPQPNEVLKTSPLASVSAEEQRFYSPLVKNIAKEEGLSALDLATISGTGSEGRVTKNDILTYIAQRKLGAAVKTAGPESSEAVRQTTELATTSSITSTTVSAVKASQSGEVVPMSRMGKLIAQHMVQSVQTSAHVQSFIEVDVTNVVAWRNKVKAAFETREGEKLTFTPIFLEAVTLAIKKHPMMNVSLEGDQIVKHKNINLGMAAALPDGNLIVPVIKNADQLNLTGMTKMVNDLALRARNNTLKPDDIKGGTYTVTNVGSFGSVFGTPIINQPQVGILALGAIRKMPAVIETPEGDFIGIRSKMFLSHSYDHRVINGALGGMFIKTIADYLEAWDPNTPI
ncbi:MAG: dihydrolipoamide acetyltransferase family protein [Flavobacteriaceae bacterium]|tara:strand:+ start:8630 stop:9991 length:1362 start_codon:yes stop_codon:yes gene_type:complete